MVDQSYSLLLFCFVLMLKKFCYPFKNFGEQFLVLTKKNFRVYKRNWLLTLIQLLIPFFFVLVLFVLQFLYSVDDLERPITEIPHIPKCKGFNCRTIIYSPSNNEQIDLLMDLVSKMNQPELKFGEDIISMKNESMINDYFLLNPNKTQLGVAFDLDRSPLINVFTIYFNSSGSMIKRGDTITPLIKSINKAYCKKKNFYSFLPSSIIQWIFGNQHQTTRISINNCRLGEIKCCEFNGNFLVLLSSDV